MTSAPTTDPTRPSQTSQKSRRHHSTLPSRVLKEAHTPVVL